MISLEELDAVPVRHRETIPEEYRDEMGHMNVRWYVFLFSKGAMALFDTVGLDEQLRETAQSGSFALSQFIQYRREVLIGQDVRVHSHIVNRSDRRVHFVHYMVNETTSELAATMEVLATHIDLSVRKSAPFPEDVAEKIDREIAATRQLGWEPPLSGAIQAQRAAK
ncbi:MAG: thioesterase family protein [Planctomycetota bacterium]